MKLTPRTKKYLANKKKGGFVNQRGNSYESYFTLFHIIKNTNKYYTTLATVTYSSQENAFVDDLLVTENGKRFLYQLKTSKKLSWGSGKIRSLKFDFLSQKKIEDFHKRVFELTLVISFRSLSNFLTTKVPTQLKKCTTVFYFPYHNSLNKQILKDKNFKSELSSLLYTKNPTTDKLEALASCILASWEGSTKKNIVLADIIEKVEKIGFSFIKPRVINTLSQATKTILNAITDFSYLEAGGYFAWTYKTTDSGIIPYQIGAPEFNKIEHEIQIKNPIDFVQLEILIS